MSDLERCYICFEESPSSNTFFRPCARETGCNLWVHSECVDSSLNHVSNKCPGCKQPFQTRDKVKYSQNLVDLYYYIIGWLYYGLYAYIIRDQIWGGLKEKTRQILNNFRTNNLVQSSFRLIMYLARWGLTYHYVVTLPYYYPRSIFEWLIFYPILIINIHGTFFYHLEVKWVDYHNHNEDLSQLIIKWLPDKNHLLHIIIINMIGYFLSFIIGYLVINYEALDALSIKMFKNSYYLTGLYYQINLRGILNYIQTNLKPLLDDIKLKMRTKKKKSMIDHNYFWDFSRYPKDQYYKNRTMPKCERIDCGRPIREVNNLFIPCYSCGAKIHTSCFNNIIKKRIENGRGTIDNCFNCGKKTYYRKTTIFYMKLFVAVGCSMIEDLIYIYLYLDFLWRGSEQYFNNWYDKCLGLIFLVARLYMFSDNIQELMPNPSGNNIIMNTEESILDFERDPVLFHVVTPLMIFLGGAWYYINEYLIYKTGLIPKYVWNKVYDSITNYVPYLIWYYPLSYYYQHSMSFFEVLLYFTRVTTITSLVYATIFLLYNVVKYVIYHNPYKHVIVPRVVPS